MTTLTAPDELRAAPSDSNAPRLRLRRGGRVERTVPLSDGKFTIGSSARCQLQLPAAEARPLHCLLSLEDGAAVATRWAAGVLVNGREFSKQTLTAGDRLSIGPWDIEWEPGAAPSSSDQPAPGGATNGARAPQRDTIDWLQPTVQNPVANGSSAKPTPPSGHESQPPHEAMTTALIPASGPITPSPRPAAKTMLVSSRLTECFEDLLGPARPALAEPPVVVDSAPARDPATAAFEDRLVLELWTGRSAARRRARSLVKATRSARNRVAELTAAVAGLEEELAAARIRADEQVVEHERQLAALRAELEDAAASRDALTAELEAVRHAPAKSAPPDPRLQALGEAAAHAESEAAELRQQLATRDEQLEDLEDQRRAVEAARAAAEAAEAARSAIESQFSALEEQQRQWLLECQTLEQERAEALAEVIAERDELQQRLDNLAAAATPTVARVSEAAPPHASATQPAAASTTWSQTPEDVEPESAPAAAPAAAWDEQAALVDEQPSRDAEPAPTWPVLMNESTHNEANQDDGAGEWTPEDPAVDEPETSFLAAPPAEFEAPHVAESTGVFEPPRVEEPRPAPAPYTPSSFIDKYRHLLDEGGDAEPSPRLSRPVLDDEYMSLPKSGESTQGPEEESDEALEAYMSNMMRRVRGETPNLASYSGSAAAGSTELGSARYLENRPAEAPEPVVDSQRVVDDEPEIELDANGMLRLARKEPASADLSALRELANTSARSAIAHHRQRRHVESAVTKSAICLIGAGAAAYLLLTAPDIRSPWFWGGCTALAIAGGAAVQLALLTLRRIKDRRNAPATANLAAAFREIATDAGATEA